MRGWQVGYLHDTVEELNSGQARTNPDSGRLEDLNQGPPDFKSSTLSHSTTPPSIANPTDAANKLISILKCVDSSFSHLGFKFGTLGMIHIAITVEQVTLQGLPWFLKEIIKWLSWESVLGKVITQLKVSISTYSLGISGCLSIFLIITITTVPENKSHTREQ